MARIDDESNLDWERTREERRGLTLEERACVLMLLPPLTPLPLLLRILLLN
jgi:hypothetical protein